MLYRIPANTEPGQLSNITNGLGMLEGPAKVMHDMVNAK
jgi:hypothetical protein